ncbi:MAG: hypothetical protein RJA57_526 [Bacteroidota bacterium]|jgi:chromosome segregation ATPase
MSQTEAQLKRIQDKLQQLLRKHALLLKDHQRLTEALQASRNKQDQQQAAMEVLQEQVSILKAAAGELNERERKEFEKRITGYLKEIDRCIALLGE